MKWIEEQPALRDVGTVLKAKVDSIEKLSGSFRIHYTEKREQKTLEAKYVILATGIMDVQPVIGGSIEPILPYANKGTVIY